MPRLTPLTSEAINRPVVGLVVWFWTILMGGVPLTKLHAAEKPNVLLIFVDDMRADSIAALGNPAVITPNLDALAKRSRVFQQAYCLGGNSAAVCTPSRNMLLSGNSFFRWGGKPVAPATDSTFPAVMKRLGYQTYHHGKKGNTALAIQAQFDINKYLANDEADRLSGHSGKVVIDEAISFLKTRGESQETNPFFMYLAPGVPHDPRVPAPENAALYRDREIPLPSSYLPQHPFDNGEMVIRDEKLLPWPRKPEVVRENLRNYYATITGFDRELGRLWKTLDDLKLTDNTIVIFSADQGIAVGSHGLLGKQNLYEHSMRVPMLWAGPGISPGESNALVYLLDVFPTVCQFVGGTVPQGLDGRSYADVLRGQTTTARSELLLAYRHVQRAIRDDRWKLIRYPQVNVTQLFDLQEDPEELHNLADKQEQRERVQQLTKKLQEAQKQLGDTQPFTEPNPRPAAWSPPEEKSEPFKKPHVLFFSIDDLNDWIEPLGGHPLVKTPHLNRLAKKGMVFTNAHCQAPLCNPSRTSVLTGLRPSTTGIYALNPWFRTVEKFRDHVTLPQHFRQHGYRVVTGGKIFHDAYPPPEGRKPNTEFTEWGPHGSLRPFPQKKFVETPDKIAAMDWGVFPERDEETFDWDIANWAVEQIKTADPKQPQFLCVGFRHPHVPCFAPQKWFDLYPDTPAILPPILEDDRNDVPPFAWYLHWKLPEPRLAWLQRNHQWQPLVRAYLASISYMDSQVGRVLDALEASPMKDDTIVVLWSDHGWHLGEKGITGKNTLWERSTRVPLIFSGPGVPANATCSEAVELLDIYPTLAELCDLPDPKGIEGHSLVPLMRNPRQTREFPAITTHGPGNHTVRSDRYRYIRYANGDQEFYDLQSDPEEWFNLAGKPEFESWMIDHARWLPRKNVPPAPESKTRLLELKGDQVYWEGELIPPGTPIPE